MSRTKSFFLLGLLFFAKLTIAQKHPDPFTLSSRLPDISLGIGAMLNSEEQFEVIGTSIVITGDYYDFVRNYSFGLELARNLDRLGQHESNITNPTRLELAEDIEGLTYDHTVVALRGGRMFKDKFILVLGIGLEFLKQYRFYERSMDDGSAEKYFIPTGSKEQLLHYKLALSYKFKRFSLEGFYSRRGIGVSLNFFINQSGTF